MKKLYEVVTCANIASKYKSVCVQCLPTSSFIKLLAAVARAYQTPATAARSLINKKVGKHYTLLYFDAMESDFSDV